MAFAFSTNVAVSGASDLARAAIFLFTLKALLKLNGWTVQGSSTGSGGAFDNAGADLWVSAASIIGTGAWVRLRHTATGIEVVLAMRNSAGAEEFLGLVWSRAAQFTGGSPSTTVIPIATDQVVVADRASGHINIPTANFTGQFGCDNASPAFYAMAPVATGNLGCLMIFEWMAVATAGDALPGVGWADGAGGNLNLSTMFNSSRNGGGYQTDNATARGRTTSNGFWISFHLGVSGVDVMSFVPAADPRDGKDKPVEAIVWLDGVNAHRKGSCRMLHLEPVTLSLLDTLDTKARIVIGSSTGARFSLPYDGATTPSF